MKPIKDDKGGDSINTLVIKMKLNLSNIMPSNLCCCFILKIMYLQIKYNKLIMS